MHFQNFYILIFKKNLSSKKFSLSILIIILFILLLSFILNRINLSLTDNDIIKNYQINKVNQNNFSSTNILFVGDSSCGNAINAEYFTKLSHQKTSNLALTGSWGILGSLGMIKKAKNKNIIIKNIIIIQTLYILGI